MLVLAHGFVRGSKKKRNKFNIKDLFDIVVRCDVMSALMSLKMQLIYLMEHSHLAINQQLQCKKEIKRSI